MTTPVPETPKPVIYNIARNLQVFLTDSLTEANENEQLDVWKVFVAMCFVYNLQCEVGKRVEYDYVTVFLTNRADKTKSSLRLRRRNVEAFEKLPEAFKLAIARDNTQIVQMLASEGLPTPTGYIDDLTQITKLNDPEFLGDFFTVASTLEQLSVTEPVRCKTLLSLLRSRV